VKAQVVFINRHYPRSALQIAPSDFVAIQTASSNDIVLADEISGDVSRREENWFFNATQGTLISAKVLGHFPTLISAIVATELSDSTEAQDIRGVPSGRRA
jgi:hypothetical protein